MGYFESPNFRLVVQLVPSQTQLHIEWMLNIYKIKFTRYKHAKGNRPKEIRAFAFMEVLAYLRDNYRWESTSMINLKEEMHGFFDACRKEGINPEAYGL